MAEILVNHSLSDSIAVKFNVDLKQYVLKGEEGDSKWVLEVGTTYLDSGGNVIPPKFLHLTTLESLEDEIEKAVSDMCALIDWGVLLDDKHPPYIDSYVPVETEGVSISTEVRVIIKEELPSAGIDLSGVVVTLDNGVSVYDITNEVTVTGDPYEYRLKWYSQNKVYDTYGE